MKTFDDFWKSYPRKINKKAAHKAWEKLTPLDHQLAVADIEKRTRQFAWSSNPKLIPHAATYLNAERWTDEWESEVKARADGLPSNPVVIKPKDTTPELPWQEKMLNRVYFVYVRLAAGLPEVKSALKIKRSMLEKDWPFLAQDIEADPTQRATLAIEFATLFAARLDHQYGLSLKNRTLAAARKK